MSPNSKINLSNNLRNQIISLLNIELQKQKKKKNED